MYKLKNGVEIVDSLILPGGYDTTFCIGVGDDGKYYSYEVNWFPSNVKELTYEAFKKIVEVEIIRREAKLHEANKNSASAKEFRKNVL